ncbi:general transcription factor 3C polypeptide 1-like [Ylistrum balloti]|uniref:general transcription factor 3C polypeptide 1-like n=1 Tax=Ylistrum balloti TaxID=509963 RepID=UPI002905A863|nr:general transcription factor 3C polypeptide 1-like [Ylistrum balloti]
MGLPHDVHEILKVGVTVERYVSFRNARPWVTHAYKNVKGRGVRQTTEVDDADSESLQELLSNPLGYRNTSVPAPGPTGDATPILESTGITSTVTALTSDLKDKTSTSDEVTAFSTTENQQDLKESGPTSSGLQSLDTTVLDRGHQSGEETSTVNLGESAGRPKRVREQTKTNASAVSSTATPKPISTYQRVRLICSPWRKPEGNLNKPLFKTMVESMMFKIMASPGISFQTLCDNYTPFNPPFLKQQILQILEDIKAIEKSIIRRQIKPTLFSKRVSPQPGKIHKENDTVVYFPTKVCITRLGQFMEYISNC